MASSREGLASSRVRLSSFRPRGNNRAIWDRVLILSRMSILGLVYNSSSNSSQWAFSSHSSSSSRDQFSRRSLTTRLSLLIYQDNINHTLIHLSIHSNPTGRISSLKCRPKTLNLTSFLDSLSSLLLSSKVSTLSMIRKSQNFRNITRRPLFESINP